MPGLGLLHGDLRKRRRKLLHYPAWIMTGPRAPLRKCMLWDISDSGARVTDFGDWDPPEQFILLLARDGSSRRRCRRVWREDDRMGVAFLRPAAKPILRL